jgi:hypothetical protein
VAPAAGRRVADHRHREAAEGEAADRRHREAGAEGAGPVGARPEAAADHRHPEAAAEGAGQAGAHPEAAADRVAEPRGVGAGQEALPAVELRAGQEALPAVELRAVRPPGRRACLDAPQAAPHAGSRACPTRPCTWRRSRVP